MALVAAVAGIAAVGCGSTVSPRLTPPGPTDGPATGSIGPSAAAHSASPSGRLPNGSPGSTTPPRPSIPVVPGSSSLATTFSIVLDPRHLPLATTRAVAFANGVAILVVGGLTGVGTTATTERIPLDGSPVASGGRLLHPVHDAAGASLGGSRLVIGGGATTQDSWVQTVPASGTGALVGSLPAPRADLGAAIVGSEAIIVGGGAGGRADGRVLATRDGVHFRLIATLPIPVRYGAVVAVGDRVFVIGGAAATGDTNAIQVVDVAGGSARVVGHLGTTLTEATALLIDGAIVVAGGRSRGQAVDRVVAIDPKTARSRLVGRLPRALADAAGVVVDGSGYLIGGEANRFFGSIVVITAVATT